MRNGCKKEVDRRKGGLRIRGGRQVRKVWMAKEKGKAKSTGSHGG